MLTLGKKNNGCPPSNLDALRASAPAKWPIDHQTFLEQSDGGYASPNLAFNVEPGQTDIVANVFSAAEIIQNTSALVGRIPKNVWPIAGTTSGNLVVLQFLDDWSVGFWDHETEKITRINRNFSEFSESVERYVPNNFIKQLAKSVTISKDFASKFAKYIKK